MSFVMEIVRIFRTYKGISIGWKCVGVLHSFCPLNFLQMFPIGGRSHHKKMKTLKYAEIAYFQFEKASFPPPLFKQMKR